MRVVLDIETNGKDNPTKIWVICCLDIDTNELHIFRRVNDDPVEKEKFLVFSKFVSLWIGHNIISYDFPVLLNLLHFDLPSYTSDRCIDTLVVSKLNNYSRQGGHSLESYGEELNFPKNLFSDWSKYSQELEDRCATDVRLGLLVYNVLYISYIRHRCNTSAIDDEQNFQQDCLELSNNGFGFNTNKANTLLEKV